MATVYVVHSDADLDFVRSTLLRPLPSLGVDRWVSSSLVGQRALLCMERCRAILIVVSGASLGAPGVRDEIAMAIASRSPAIVVLAAAVPARDRARFPEGLWSLPAADFAASPEAARRDLANLLPPMSGVEDVDVRLVAEPIEWREEIFSARLAAALSRHDYSRAQGLIETFTRHAKDRTYPYPPDHAVKDLYALRQQRHFKLMRRYAEAALASGTASAEVRRQYAQSLIEQRVFGHALRMLESIVIDSTSPEKEVAEARGLIGRAYKQQYVDAPGVPAAPDLLRRAIDAYASVYDEDPSWLWHGVNAATLIRRAHRDGLPDADPARARRIAEGVLSRIEQLRKEGTLQVWDYATAVEALVALERYDAAAGALDAYLRHPDIHAFEVSSTYRQFDEVIQLDQDERGRPLLERLWKSVERHRAGGFSDPLPARSDTVESVREAASAPGGRSLIIRLADPDWDSTHIADLDVQARLGTIVSARGSEVSVKALLSDPQVISVTESRPSGAGECDRSVPFIRVADSYPGPGGPWVEKGSEALIAVIDDGIDVLHQAFLDADGRSRIVGIWDQRDPAGPPPPDLKRGTYHDEAAVASYVAAERVPKALQHRPGVDGHGTHVASIAAGRRVGEFAGGVAPEAKLLIVIPASHEPVGYSSSHVEALSFIDAVATRLGRPVVVNISQGMNAGAHDGQSELEVAFVEFTGGGRKPGRVVVKSAGNERQLRGHAMVTVTTGTVEELRWTRDPGASPGEELQLWWNSADEFEFRLRRSPRQRDAMDQHLGGSAGRSISWRHPVSDPVHQASSRQRRQPAHRRNQRLRRCDRRRMLATGHQRRQGDGGERDPRVDRAWLRHSERVPGPR